MNLSKNMFPLIAIAAFFILGIAFFAIGKDDFGIKKVNEGSNKMIKQEEEIIEKQITKGNQFSEVKQELNSKPLTKSESTEDINN